MNLNTAISHVQSIEPVKPYAPLLVSMNMKLQRLAIDAHETRGLALKFQCIYGIEGREFDSDWCGLRQSNAVIFAWEKLIKFMIIYVHFYHRANRYHFDFIFEVNSSFHHRVCYFCVKIAFKTDTDGIHIPFDDRLQSNSSSYKVSTTSNTVFCPYR